MVRAPVALILYNRPEHTLHVFEEIRRARPRTLLVVADGPRNEQEHDRCERARSVVQKVDWPCDVRLNFSEQNLGCRRRVSSGIDWIFDEVNHAIILEDDCLPHTTFFRFCDEMLERYRDEPRIMHVGGVNFQFDERPGSDSYYFSGINTIWGWATWRRAWHEHYDVTMKRWPAARETRLIADLFGEDVSRRMTAALDNIHAGKTDSWDSQWAFAMWLAGGLAVLPSVNLISNIGFGPDATHTKKLNSRVANQPTEAMDFPLKHPARIERNREADNRSYRNMIAAKAL